MIDMSEYDDWMPHPKQQDIPGLEWALPKGPFDTLAYLSDISKKYNAKVHQKILDHGFKIFPITSENDFKSVETDFGAPSIGLEFYRSLMDPTRPHRYEPVHTILGTYLTHAPQSIDIGRAMLKQGFKIFKDIPEKEYPTQIYFANGGVTRAFSDTIDSLIDEYEKIQEEKVLHGKEQAGAFLMPVPTYGLFYGRLESAIEGRNISIIPVRRAENGAVEISSLKAGVAYARANNIQLLGYYDCNPNNPSGYIRQRAETEEIAEVLMEESRQYQEEDIAFFEQGQYKENVRHWLFAGSKPHSKIVIIDDMAYEGLEHTDRKKPFSFGQVSKEVADQTVVLKGISKIGLPGARIGLMFGHVELTSPLNERQLSREFSAHTLGVDLLAARYGDTSPFKRQFNQHLERLRGQHVRKAGIIEAFFRGLDHADKLTDRQKEKLVTSYAEYKNISKDESREKLKGGLAPFKIPDEMDCGFFHRVNVDALRGRKMAIKLEESPRSDVITMQDSSDAYWAFRAFGMHVVSWGGMGCDTNELTVRITLSLPEKELFRFYDSMHEMRTHFFGEKPEVQQDLFRRTYPILSNG